MYDSENNSSGIGFSRRIAVVALPALLAGLVFSNILGNDFVYDDRETLQRLEGLSQIPWWELMTRPRGLTYSVHLLDRWLWVDWAPGFHLTSLALHALASALVAAVALSLTRRPRPSLLCGLIFAVHPVHVEAVASFSNRKDILALVFVCLTVILWASAARSWPRYLGSLVCLVLALQSKEVAAVGVVPMLFLVDLMPRSDPPAELIARVRQALYRALPLLGLVLAAGLRFGRSIVECFSGASIRHTVGVHYESYAEVLATSLGSVPAMLRLLFFPLRLSADYPTGMEQGMDWSRATIGVAFVALWVLACIFAVRRSPMVAFSASWVLITYVPVSNVVPLTKFFLTDRYLYVPSLGVCLLAALALERLAELAGRREGRVAQSFALGLPVMLILALGVRTVTRNTDWSDSGRLWGSAVADGFSTARAHGNFGRSLADAGDLEGAIREYRESILINGNFSKAHMNLGNALARQERWGEAVAAYRRALALDPQATMVLFNLAIALARQGAPEQSASALRSLLQLDAEYPGAQLMLGTTLAQQRKFEESVVHFRLAIAREPESHDAHYYLGLALLRLQQVDPARTQLAEAVRLDPGSVRALYHLALADAEAGDPEQAVRVARRGLQLARETGNERHAELLRQFLQQIEAGPFPRHGEQ